jgi:hypothetical protein
MAPWKETEPGRYSRPIGENETFIKLVSDPAHPLGREHWAINSTVTIAPQGKLTSSILRTQLRRAWGHLRFHHPSLAAHVAEDNENLEYNVPTPEELSEWVSQTFSVDEEALSSAEVIPNLKPSPYATLIYIPKSNELLGHTAHWRTDGIGVMLLLDHLLSLAVDPKLPDPFLLPWGSEPTRLAPSIEDAACIPQTPTAQQTSLGTHYAGTFALAAGAIGIPHTGTPSTPPGGTHSVLHSLSPTLTAAIIQRCKSLGISVTSAIHASIAAANWSLASPERKSAHYTSTVRFSLRPYLPDGPPDPAGLYTTGWMEKVCPENTWLEHAQIYHKIYSRGISQEYISAHRAYASCLGAMLRSLPPDLPIQSDVDISSIGVAEAYVQRAHGDEGFGIDVRGVSVGVEMCSRQAVCFVWTYRERLSLNVVYNEVYHGRGQMEGFVGE